jgi:hypothetical protein
MSRKFSSTGDDQELLGVAFLDNLLGEMEFDALGEFTQVRF